MAVNPAPKCWPLLPAWECRKSLLRLDAARLPSTRTADPDWAADGQSQIAQRLCNGQTSSKTIANSIGLKMPLAQFPLGRHAMNKRAKYRHSPKSGCALAA
ncbi:MAG: hypothetical protein ACFNZS_08220 [Ottowia sp.]